MASPTVPREQPTSMPSKVQEKPGSEPESGVGVAKDSVKSPDVEETKTDDSRSSRARELFFCQLRALLSDRKLSHALWWSDGTLVINPKPFIQSVLQKHFVATKFCSFQRRLNRWGFFRVQNIPAGNGCGDDLLAYKNPAFKLEGDESSDIRQNHSVLLPVIGSSRPDGLVQPRPDTSNIHCLRRRLSDPTSDGLHIRGRQAQSLSAIRQLLQRRSSREGSIDPSAAHCRGGVSPLNGSRDRHGAASAEENAALEALLQRERSGLPASRICREALLLDSLRSASLPGHSSSLSSAVDGLTAERLRSLRAQQQRARLLCNLATPDAVTPNLNLLQSDPSSYSNSLSSIERLLASREGNLTSEGGSLSLLLSQLQRSQHPTSLLDRVPRRENALDNLRQEMMLLQDEAGRF